MRLDKIDIEMENVNNKIDSNEVVNKRMDMRLSKLEEEMRRSEMIRKRSQDLRNQEKLITSQEEEMKNKTAGNPRKPIEENDPIEELQRKLRSSFRSDWAQEMEENLNEAAREAEKTDSRLMRREDRLQKLFPASGRKGIYKREKKERFQDRRKRKNRRQKTGRREPLRLQPTGRRGDNLP